MTQGTFQVGETVHGSLDIPGILHSTYISFRVAAQNHKYGPYDAPSDTFTINPYDQTTTISDTYSATSTILNVDTYSLANQPQGQFYGNVETGITLRGQSSGAEATLDSTALITDNIGTVIGSFFIPNPNILTNPKFEAGTKLFRLTNSDTNSQIPGSITTSAQENYFVEGKVNTTQEQIISLRNSKVVEDTVTESENISENIASTRPARRPPRSGGSPSGGGKIYQGRATGYIEATGTYGFVDQNAGNFSPYRASVGQPPVISQPALGRGAVNRALASDYSLASIKDYASKPGVIVGPEAAKILGIPPKPQG